MVQEVRKIVLSEDELISAFECYRRMTPGFLPEGQVIYCRPVNEATVQVTIETTVDGTAKFQECTVRDTEVLKPLIRFCIENNIMLPKNGRKSVALFNGEMVICIALSVDIDTSEYVSPMRIHHLNKISPAEIQKTKIKA